jgi:hypothetical protein
MESIASWLSRGVRVVVGAGLGGALLMLFYNVVRNRNLDRRARETIHQLLRPRFEELAEHVRNRGPRPDGMHAGLGTLASGWLKEIVQLLAQNAEKLPKNERRMLLDAAEKTRKMDVPPTIGVPTETYKAARDALVNAVEVLTR